ncbi:MAG: hypothetical protein AAGF81_19195 [Pseudomonadota bacterium]
MSFKDISSLFACMILCAFVLVDSAAANSTAKKLRGAIEQRVLQKSKKLSRTSDRKLGAACALFHAEILALEKRHRCKGDCYAKVKKYGKGLDALMADLSTKWKRTIARELRAKLPVSTMVGMCLRIAIAQKNHTISYGLGRMLARSVEYGPRINGGTWAFTSLALGKGVARSKKAAAELVTELAKSKEIDKRTKAGLTTLGLSLYLDN